ncbi:MAG: helix-turn-helix transcriptional regulator [Muribaculaceae bacterium]|nr:helix-turn-helix transcriptional regulator [Muribaculaceae bacterium]
MIAQLLMSMPMMVCGVCTMFALLKWLEQRTLPLRWLVVFLFTATTLYGCHYLYFNHVTTAMPVIDVVYCLCNLLVFPLFFLYLSKQAVGSLLQRRIPRAAVLLAPAVVLPMAIAGVYAAMGTARADQFIACYIFGGQWTGFSGLALVQRVLHILVKVLFAIQIIPIVWAGRRMMREHDDYVRDNYADTEGRTLGTLNNLMVVVFATSLASFVANLVGRSFFDNGNTWLLAVPSIVFSALLFAVAYVSMKQDYPMVGNVGDDDIDLETADLVREHTENGQYTDVAEDGGEPATARNASEDNPANPDQNDADNEPGKLANLYDDIMRFLKDEKLFLKHDLRIADLVDLVHSNRNYIQQAIHAEMGCTFSELVNRLRVEYAVELMRKHPEMPVAVVADKSGYQSLASFYRNFKLINGCTPKDFKR